MFKKYSIVALLLFVISIGKINSQQLYHELYRPQFHFSPKSNWMNDPNGMFYYKGVYHLFFQYYPDKPVWGPMHWGHATSKDLIHWKELPIALYPDSLGYIFSGSAVVDSNNTSGFGKKGQIPFIAIFTHHNTVAERNGKNNFQNESIAYSLDEGNTWIKYAGNPVLKNPGITDFRDPKVMWFEKDKKWIMSLATKDHITFYSSKNLKDWSKESEFGKEFGAHGGVWECPDLFSLNYEGKNIWVLFVSINPGGPNGGSATQYFTGNFDGHTFKPFQTDTRWIDYGKDDYAGVTWSNTGKRKIFLGWMSNWQYGEKVPTEKWRSTNTVPRSLSLQKIGEKYFLTAQPVKELDNLIIKTKLIRNAKASNLNLTDSISDFNGMAKLKLTADKLDNFSLIFSNDNDEKLIIGYDKQANNYYIDRTYSGIVDFQKDFIDKSVAPRISNKTNMNISVIIDKTSIEFFADNGLSVMTSIFFPKKPFKKIQINSPNGLLLKTIEYSGMNSIWK